MAFLSKLPDDPAQPGVSQWELLATVKELIALLVGRVTSQELSALFIASTRETVGFEVHIPKDTPIVNERARIVLRAMPAELAARRRIVEEHEGRPELIAEEVKKNARQRLKEMHLILGDDEVAAALPEFVKAVKKGKP